MLQTLENTTITLSGIKEKKDERITLRKTIDKLEAELLFTKSSCQQYAEENRRLRKELLKFHNELEMCKGRKKR